MIILYGGFVDLSANKGDAVHALELTSNLRKLGNRVIVVAHASEPRTDPDFFNTGAYGDRAPACDVLYMRDYLFCTFGAVAKALYSRKIIWEVNGIAGLERAQGPHPLNFLALPLINLLERLAGKSADRIAPVSKGVMDVLLARGCPRSRVVLLENGVNVEMFAGGDFEARVIENEKKRFGIPASVPIIGYVGAIRPWQGLDVLVLAAREVKRRGIDVRFLVVGGGEGLSAVKDEAEAEGVADIFVFTGSVEYERVPLMLALSDVCVAPFTGGRAASPMKVYEYMASGIPMVASRIPGLEFIEEKGLGRLVDPGDSAMLADSLVDLLGNRGNTEEMAVRAREDVVRNHSWLSVARKAEALCVETAAGSRSARRLAYARRPAFQTLSSRQGLIS